MTFSETLHSWQNFYFMIGGAAAALIGLMLVAISMGRHLISEQTKHTFEIYATPNIFYFVSAMLIACLMLVPALPQMVLAILLGIGSIVGMGINIPYVRGLIASARRNKDYNLGDWLAMVVGPVLSYSLMIIAAGCFGLNWWSAAFMILWVASVVILLIAIINTWGLVVWIILHGDEARQDSGDAS